MTDSNPTTPSDADLVVDIDLLRTSFGLSELADTSLSPFARVYRGRSSHGRDVVVKRTADRTATAVAEWTTALAGAGVAMVMPEQLPVANPQLIGEEHWVVYPFVEGDPYRGTADQIRTAGAALGSLHAAQVASGDLQQYSFPDTSWDEVQADLVTLRGVCDAYAGNDADRLHAHITELATAWHSTALPALVAADRSARLPRTGGTTDHKAANLVYSDGPVMVDPDNAERLPRILDLALALVTFHNECPTAPGRMLDADEWALFVRGYRTRVLPTPAEEALWPAAVLHQWWEEGTWALEDNDVEAWADRRQRGYLLSLAAVDPGIYRL